MWIASQYGYFSITRKRKDEYHICALELKDISNLKALAGLSGAIQQSERAAFRFRIKASLEEMLEVMVQLGGNIDYGDFRERVEGEPDQRHKSGAYAKVDDTMRSVQKVWP